ncbi:MAG: diacylglycerol kinase family protein [Saprospiraceae bacterium]
MKNSKPFNQYPWWIILNPTAGNGLAARRKVAIEQLLQKCGFKYEMVETKNKEHAFQLVAQGIQKGYRHIMGIGGDGTNNEIINGILQQKIIAPPEIIYTLIPLGTGNDWIKQHQIPSNWKKWIPKIAKGKVISHNAGLLHFHKNGKPAQRYFINVAGLAYDAFVTKRKEEVTPVFFPVLFYLWQVLVCLFQYRLRKATVEFDNNTITDHFYTINIGICKYSGGGMQFVPHADPNSENLALTIAGPVSKVTVLTHIPHIFLGKLHKHPKVNIYKTKAVEIRAAEAQQTTLEADGEFLGETPVSCVLVEKALCILVP